jgi:hypothetical protein
MTSTLSKNRILHGDALRKGYFLNIKENRKNPMNSPFCTPWNALSNGILFVLFSFSFHTHSPETLCHFRVEGPYFSIFFLWLKVEKIQTYSKESPLSGKQIDKKTSS